MSLFYSKFINFKKKRVVLLKEGDVGFKKPKYKIAAEKTQTMVKKSGLIVEKIDKEIKKLQGKLKKPIKFEARRIDRMIDKIHVRLDFLYVKRETLAWYYRKKELNSLISTLETQLEQLVAKRQKKKKEFEANIKRDPRYYEKRLKLKIGKLTYIKKQALSLAKLLKRTRKTQAEIILNLYEFLIISYEAERRLRDKESYN